MYYQLCSSFNDYQKPFGVVWYTDEGEEIGTDYYSTDEERQEAIDRWYSQTQDIFTEN